MHQRNRNPAGFTLIELLVVLAIISILATLILPALSRGKAKAQSAVCLSNLKQLSLAWTLYTQDNADALPPNWQDGLDYSIEPANWVGGRLSYENYFGLPTDYFRQSTNIALLLDPYSGRIGPYARSAGVFRCPSDKSYIIIDSQRFPRVRSYSMNEHMGYQGDHAVPRTKVLQHRTMNQIASPSLRWLFIDEHEDGIRGGGFEFTANQFEKAYWMDIPASRHAGSGTISFADGHVESRKWLSPKTYVPVLHVRQFAIWMDGDKRDIEWLWLRTTTPITVPVFQ